MTLSLHKQPRLSLRKADDVVADPFHGDWDLLLADQRERLAEQHERTADALREAARRNIRAARARRSERLSD